MFCINPGELRTDIRIQKPVTTGSGVSKKTTWPDLGNASEADPPRFIKCKWVGLNGNARLLDNAVVDVGDALLTLRYKEINEQCRIVKDGANYQVINIDDPTQHKQWLVIRVKAVVNGS